MDSDQLTDRSSVVGMIVLVQSALQKYPIHMPDLIARIKGSNKPIMITR